MTQITINPSDRIGTINPNIYGHFAEHLGRCIYDGIWVGEDSPIPNTDGIRNDVIAALRRIKPPVIRWPGGCFADDYHWQDGIGPRAERPRRDQHPLGRGHRDQRVRHAGVHPLLPPASARSPTSAATSARARVRELRDWVEYCNFAGDSTLGAAARRRRQPGAVRRHLLGRGQRELGLRRQLLAGGLLHRVPPLRHLRARLRRNRSSSSPAARPATTSSGRPASSASCARTTGTSATSTASPRTTTAARPARPPSTPWTSGTSCIARGLEMEPLVVQQRAAMDAFDPQRKIGLIVDEWGTWHPVEPGTNPRLPLPAEHAARRPGGGDHAGHLQPPRRQGGDGQHRPDDQRAAGDGPDRGRADAGHAHRPRLRDVRAAPGRRGAAHAGRDARSISFTERRASRESLPAVAGSASLKGKTLFVTLTNSHASEARGGDGGPAGRRARPPAARRAS